MASEITREQAIALYESGFWASMQPWEIAEFQLLTTRLCMPFDVFQAAVEKALGRPVWTHEFAGPKRLLAELRGDKPTATFEEILALIPADKRVIVVGR